MTAQLHDFLIHWGVMSLALWLASQVFRGLTFTSGPALLLGLANAVLRPLLILLTLPLTFLTLGLFLLVINALMIQLVAAMVHGFKVSGFWTAFFAGIFIALFGVLMEVLLPGSSPVVIPTGRTISI